ncbi:HAD family hydrolase [Ralstonia syzygii subsp. celebesensis]|uniref:HAD family hydrolase n=2 Tax=Ralstonia syzygii subsp. celebesensis TaxID=1310168 RepID=A0A1U9VIQ5_9RALS|nr:HAD family phosphatase [Ralstonia syzygii]AQW29951.1 HAD family hydrolase [blood disease bacterium A2-HR MARDI]QQV56211.1 HAD family phosphatase [Ralstonia syzygii subsp. celebesensis]CCA80410.1 putative haloacid dehalogenase-like hydrolase [blood disease bacterium R229]
MTEVSHSAPAGRRFDAILFDCDGVLVDSEPLVNRLIWQMLNELGIDISLEDSTKRFLGKAIREELDAIAAMRGAPLPPNWLSTFHARRNALLEAEVEAVPHVADAIEALSALGLPMAVASGADRMKVELQLNRTGLIRRFQPTDARIFSATEVERSKPAPDVYLLAARRLGVAPSRCVVIEDSPTGVTAGHTAGMTVLAYAGRNAPGPLIAAGAARTFTDMRHLPALLA